MTKAWRALAILGASFAAAAPVESVAGQRAATENHALASERTSPQSPGAVLQGDGTVIICLGRADRVGLDRRWEAS